jgi:uncharacterized membrane protein
VSAGITGLFATVVVAVRVYELVPAVPALLAAFAVGAVAVVLALRWDLPGLAALGVVGGLAAPAVLGGPAEPGTLALLWVAGAAAAAVLARRRWDRLGAVASVLLAPQWVAALLGEPSPAEAVATLVAFGALAAVVAAAPVLRGRAVSGPGPAADAERPDGAHVPAGLPRAAVLLALNALALGAAGWSALAGAVAPAAGDGWLVVLALAHLAAGAAALTRPGADPARRALGLAGLALGMVVADVALAQLLDGVALGLAWAGSSVAFAAVLGRLRSEGSESALVLAALTGHVLLAIGHTLAVTAPLELLDAAAPALGEAGPGLAGLAAGLFASGALIAGRPEGRLALHALGVATITYLLALALDGPALAAAYAAEAILLARVSVPAAAALTSAALVHALCFEAPPAALDAGLADPLGALVALGAAAAAALATAAGAPDRRVRTAGGAIAALAVLFLTSTALVTAVGPGEQAQAALSALWALTGVAALVTGLLGDVAPLRAGALALLLGTLTKVFLYDLATLDAMARVASFLVLGLLLLLAAFAWQRIRPRPSPATP